MDKAGRSPFPHGAGVLLGNSGPEEQVHSRESPLCSGWSWSNFWYYYLGQAQSSHLLTGESRRSVLKLYLLVHSHLVQGIEDLMEIPGGREGNGLGVQSRRCCG